MKFGWRIILIVVVIVAVMALIFFGFKKSDIQTSKETALENLNITPSPKADNLPAATGNVDSAISSFLLDSDSEASVILNDTTDASAMSYENTEISNFGQSYENDF